MIFGNRQQERAVEARPTHMPMEATARTVDADIPPHDLDEQAAMRQTRLADRDDGVERVDAFERVDQAERAQRGEQVEQVERVERAERAERGERVARGEHADDSTAPLFTSEAARDFQASWDAVQISFVDDPERAVRQADELVRHILQDLEKTFSNDRAALDARGNGAADASSTENLRLALRRYRAFMQRLLSL